MKTAYFDCFSGASGDMILGSIIDAGWPAAELESTLAKLGLSDYSVRIAQVVKQGIGATSVSFVLPAQPTSRRFGDLLEIVHNSRLAEEVKAEALRILRLLAQAEAKVHGVQGPLDELHLHELGSFDTLFDIVGCIAGIMALRLARVVVSPIQIGGGVVHTSHGTLPVPVPAVAELIRGLPVAGGLPDDGELLTPTGAALMSGLAAGFGPMPPLKIAGVGYGAGRREGRLPNVLRLWIGESIDLHADEVVVLETNVDDMSPELQAAAMERLLSAGALDAYLTPVVMKKGRPGTVITVISQPDRAAELEVMLFAETTTLGVRRALMSRRKLEREHVVVETPFGQVRVKVGTLGHTVLVASPEFDDCRESAASAGVPVRVVYEAAQRAYRSISRTPKKA